jgi:hypothetical protein
MGLPPFEDCVKEIYATPISTLTDRLIGAGGTVGGVN